MIPATYDWPACTRCAGSWRAHRVDMDIKLRRAPDLVRDMLGKPL